VTPCAAPNEWTHRRRGRAGRHLRVLLPQRPGRGVAGVREHLLAGLTQPDVQLRERLHRQVHLAAHLDDLGRVGQQQLRRDAAHGAHVGGDVLADPAVATRGRLDEPTAFVREGACDPVDLQLAREPGGVVPEPTRDTVGPGPELLLGERVVEREHRRPVRDGGEQVGRRSPDALRGRVGGDQLGVGILQRAQLADELVVLGVGDLGIVEHVVAVRVEVDQLAQLLDADLGLGARALVDGAHPAISTPPLTPIRSPDTTTPPRTPGTRCR